MKQTNSQRLTAIERKAQALQAKLDALADQWESLSYKMQQTGSQEDVDNIVPSEWTIHCVENDLGTSYRFKDILA